MYMLVLQTFLMLLAAFVLGAALACLFKRTLHGGPDDELEAETAHVNVPPAVPISAPVHPPVAAPPVPPVTAADAERFGRALQGAEQPDADAVAVPTGPAVEVQPTPLPAGETYAAIAVASHDGSTLPPPGVVEAQVSPPVMPGPDPEPLPIPAADVPAPVRPADAPEPPAVSYTQEAADSGITYTPEPEPAAEDFEFTPDPSDESELPAGESYTSVALGLAGAAAAAAAAGTMTSPAEDEAPVAPGEPEVSEDTAPGAGTTLTTAAVAAAAGIAAGRAVDGAGDDLTKIRGIDNVLASRLNYAGVDSFAQIAAWDADDVRRMSQTLGFFGRIEDEYWREQARLLAAGDSPADLSPPAPEPPPAAAPPEDPPPSEPSSGGAGHAAASAAAAAAAAALSAASLASQSEAPSEAPAPVETPPEDMAGDGDDSSRRVTGLRSVRAEALVGDDANFVSGDHDDLKRIRGIGVLIEKKLNSLGVTSYEQVANWSADDIERISQVLDFRGRIERENWIEQARILASGGQTEFSRRVDRGDL